VGATVAAMRVDLCEAHHPERPEMCAGLLHLLGTDRVEARLATGVGDNKGRDHAEVARPVAVEERDPFDSRPLPLELVQQLLPDGVR
jgi:hypothetical protein